MPGRRTSNRKGGDLRKKAEAILGKQPEAVNRVPPEKETRNLIHELDVHHVELELQNEELRKSQEDLAQARDKYFRLYDLAPTAYFTLDARGMILEMNFAGADLLDRKRNLLQKRPFSKWVRKEDLDLFYAHLQQVRGTGQRQACQVWLLPGRGKEVCVHMETLPLMEEEEVAPRFLSSLTDITTMKAQQEELRRAHEVLEDRVRERTADLQETTERLKQSNRELKEFAFVASHDLQEPLRKIQAFGQLLEEECAEMLGEQGQDYLMRMRSSAGRMQFLINALLDYHQMSAKEQAFSMVDLNEVVREALSNLELRVRQTGARVKVSDLPTLQASPVQMIQLFQNIIGNALKFQQAGKPPRVKVSSRVAGDQVQISVEDNGIGFEEKYADRIFNLFQKLHGKSRYEGRGMGLAICRKIVEVHGGTITARSVPHKGSTFTITLPLRQKREGERGTKHKGTTKEGYTNHQ